jgi:hypothetical protein
MKKKYNFEVSIQGHRAFIYNSPSPQNAVRRAVRVLIKTGKIKNQPETSDNGGFKQTRVAFVNI